MENLDTDIHRRRGDGLDPGRFALYGESNTRKGDSMAKTAAGGGADSSVADQLRALGVRGVLAKMARDAPGFPYSRADKLLPCFVRSAGKTVVRPAMRGKRNRRTARYRDAVGRARGDERGAAAMTASTCFHVTEALWAAAGATSRSWVADIPALAHQPRASGPPVPSTCAGPFDCFAPSANTKAFGRKPAGRARSAGDGKLRTDTRVSTG